jgi:GDPmannose 4,6-dehydratase
MSKAYAAYQVGVYRSTYNLKATNVFMGQNDSALRGGNFFTQRVVQFLTNYSRKRVIEDTLKVGDLDILRNWGHTEDYTNILASLVKEDYVGDIMVAPGTVHSTKDFINGVARHCGIDLQWSNWFGYDGRTGNLLIEQNPTLCRPKQPKILTALNTYSYKLQHNFDSIIEQMVNTSLGT